MIISLLNRDLFIKLCVINIRIKFDEDLIENKIVLLHRCCVVNHNQGKQIFIKKRVKFRKKFILFLEINYFNYNIKLIKCLL